VQAEPGVDEMALERLEQDGVPVVRWRRPNLYFGGVQTVARGPDGSLEGGRRFRAGGGARGAGRLAVMENPPMAETDFEAEGMLEGLEGEGPGGPFSRCCGS